METVYWISIGLAVLTAGVSLFYLLGYLRRKWAEKRVRSESAESKIRHLNGALSGFGFAYNEGCDCIVSDRNPWQRKMGYCRQYDDAAPAMNMIIDCEPVYFRYHGKSWLLEFWKGQYGCTTGAEIGLYYNNEEKPDKAPEELFYTSADDSNRLHMRFSLWKDGRCIMKRNGLHWWLTGFLPGLYSQPGELVMRACICFRDYDMRNAFCQGLLHTGYKMEEISVDGNRVCLTFGKPRYGQPTRFGRFYRCVVSQMNCLYCKWYRRASRPFESTLDRISFLGYCFPYLYRRLIHLGTSSNPRKLKKYARKMI